MLIKRPSIRSLFPAQTFFLSCWRPPVAYWTPTEVPRTRTQPVQMELSPSLSPYPKLQLLFLGQGFPIPPVLTPGTWGPLTQPSPWPITCQVLTVPPPRMLLDLSPHHHVAFDQKPRAVTSTQVSGWVSLSLVVYTLLIWLPPSQKHPYPSLAPAVTSLR